MHHLILFLPVIGLIVFWLYPLNIAIPLYAGIFVVSGLMYWAIIRAIRRVPVTGKRGMRGTTARVTSKLGPMADAQYMVETAGELWKADSTVPLKKGDTVSIIRVKRLKLLVKPVEAAGAPARRKAGKGV